MVVRVRSMRCYFREHREYIQMLGLIGSAKKSVENSYFRDKSDKGFSCRDSAGSRSRAVRRGERCASRQETLRSRPEGNFVCSDIEKLKEQLM